MTTYKSFTQFFVYGKKNNIHLKHNYVLDAEFCFGQFDQYDKAGICQTSRISCWAQVMRKLWPRSSAPRARQAIREILAPVQ